MLGAVGSGGSVIPLVGLVVGGCLLGVLGRDQVLSSQVRRREQRMLAEFPAVAELIALAVGAGGGRGRGAGTGCPYLSRRTVRRAAPHAR